MGASNFNPTIGLKTDLRETDPDAAATTLNALLRGILQAGQTGGGALASTEDGEAVSGAGSVIALLKAARSESERLRRLAEFQTLELIETSNRNLRATESHRGDRRGFETR